MVETHSWVLLFTKFTVIPMASIPRNSIRDKSGESSEAFCRLVFRFDRHTRQLQRHFFIHFHFLHWIECRFAFFNQKNSYVKNFIRTCFKTLVRMTFSFVGVIYTSYFENRVYYTCNRIELVSIYRFLYRF